MPACRSYLIGRDPQCDIVVNDARVSSNHAVLRLEGGRWVLADDGSTNGTYAGNRRVDRIEINGECLVRLSDPADGPVLSCAVSGAASSGLPATTLRIGREPDNDIVVSDLSVSSHHAELRKVAGAYRIVDLGSTNGTFVNEQRVTAALLSDGDMVGLGDSTFRLVGHELQPVTGTAVHAEETPPPVAAAPGADDGALEIPYAVRWLVPKGERFANFDILNDNDTQLEYYRRFGHIYAVGIPTKKWRLVVVSDPELLDVDVAREWGEPTEIPSTSAYRHLVIAYGSNFGANKELAERFAERSDFHGYTSDVMTLNELAASPPRTEPWLLVVMTSTYTSNPPSNATAFKSWLERTEQDEATWRTCRYFVWGLGNSQWNAFLAFPRYVHKKLSELGATPLAELAYGDVGSPVWERLYADWNTRVWPVLLELSGARPTSAAAARVAVEKAVTGTLTSTDSNTAMQKSLYGDDVVTQPIARSMSIPSIMRFISPGSQSPATSMGTSGSTERSHSQSRVLLVPTILTNAVGKDTVEARTFACRELQAAESPKRTQHLEISLPPGVTYRAGAHLGVCPKNDEERVERVARHLGTALDGLFMAPKTMNVRAVPKGVVLQVRNVLTNLIDITGRPTVPLLDLLLEKATDPAERSRLVEIRDVLQAPDGPGSPLRAAIDAGGCNVLRLLDEFASCSLNIFEFLRVAQPLRPRYYSTSSSPRIHGDGVAHITVGLEATPVPGMPDRDFCGMSSHYIHTLREGDRLNIFLDSADGFHLQEDVTKPMIFVSAGTGIAPMRAFLWERLALKQAGVSLAEAALFNGIRSSRLDYIYRDEIGQFAAEGVLNHVQVATSRERPGRRDYVQDRIREQGALVWRLLAADGYVYICGSQPMRDAVRAAFVDVIAEHGSMPREHAEAYLHELETTTRYRPDLWG